MGEEDTKALASPALTGLRVQDGGPMERSLSADIREEREELREAAEQTLNVIMDLSLDGNIRWVSPSWTDVIGTSPESVQGRPIANLLLDENKDMFTEVVESMKKDDSRSQIIRFHVQLGPASKLLSSLEAKLEEESSDLVNQKSEVSPPSTDLEAQGIMVYDQSSGGESHVCLPFLSRVHADNLHRRCG